MYDAMDHKISMLWCMTVLIVCCFGIIAALPYLAENPLPYRTPDHVESYTVGNFDRLQIHMTYRLGPTEDPSHIPRNDFELNGWNYHMLRIDKKELEPVFITGECRLGEGFCLQSRQIFSAG